MSESFDAFKTDLQLALLTLKNEVSKEISSASNGVLVEVRERLARSETERNEFYKEAKAKLSTLEDLARETNGQVKKHRSILLGDPEDKDSNGLVERVRSNTNWRNALVTAGGVVTFFAGMIWWAWGDDIRERGIINRPSSDYEHFIDARIQQWLPMAAKPIATPPPLVPKKKSQDQD
jgi:hypothetical protein